MNTGLPASVVLICFAGFATTDSDARIQSVTTMEGPPGKIIEAPDQALDSAVASETHMIGFDERQGVLLTAPLDVDDGQIPKGTRVDSHMILYNVPDEAFGTFAQNEWVFSGPVLGVMSDMDGKSEAASNKVLGAPATVYPTDGFYLREMEESDGYDGVGTDRLRVWMSVWQPGDWIRVITRAAPIARNPATPMKPPLLALSPKRRNPERTGDDSNP